MEKLIQKCQYCGEEKEDCYNGYTAMTLPIEEMENIIDKWGRTNWWENLEGQDLSKEQELELEQLYLYDQALNTIGRGVMCLDCLLEEDRLYAKYYPKI
jgi:hypothetical protein